MSKARTLNPYDMEERINELEEDVTSNKAALNKIAVNSCTLTYYDVNSLRGEVTIPEGFAIENAFVSVPRYDAVTAKAKLFTHVAAGNTLVLLGTNFTSGDSVTVKVAWMKA